MSLDYLANQEVKELVSNGNTYQKSAETLLRLPKDSELGKSFNTFVKSGDDVRVESTNTIGDNVVARNKEPIGKDASGANVYNEWLIPKATAEKNYGAEVISGLSSEEFSSHKKKALLKAIELTPEIMEKLGVKGNVLEIKVSWSPEPMIAHVGDHITDGGYSVSKHDMKDYEVVAKKEKVLDSIGKLREGAYPSATNKNTI